MMYDVITKANGPSVSLLYCTPDMEKNIAAIAKVCYSSKESVDDIFDEMTPSQAGKLITKLIERGHLSPLEHASFTFEITNISRACSHQLVRHRLASFTQQSQRYTEVEPKVIIPSNINKDENLKEEFYQVINTAYNAYDKLVELGVPKEDARYVLPEATRTHIIMTMNARELLHFFNCRCCEKAQWEIRAVANEMLLLCDEVAPSIFALAGSPCVSGHCPEGDNGCIAKAKPVE